MSAVESLLSQLEEAVGTADLSQEFRFRLSTQLDSLSRSIATPRQVIQHYGYMFTEQLVVNIAHDLNIFPILAESRSALNVNDIASKTRADPSLLHRILKHLAATRTITEEGESTFAANDATFLLASPSGWGNLMFTFNILNKSFQELPKMLKETEYKNPDQTSENSFQRAFDTKLPMFLFMQQDKDKVQYFQKCMSAYDSPISWTTVVPLAAKLQGTDENTPLFVDVGGGHGSQCGDFRKATQVPGRVILQDLPGTVASAPAREGVEVMVQDFFEKNQIQGARIYYTRKCLHDLPDYKAKQVLQHIEDAMSPHSFLFIDETVLPDEGASLSAMQIDFTMMALFNSVERTLSHWKRLLGAVGMKITEVHRYDLYGDQCVLEAVPING